LVQGMSLGGTISQPLLKAGILSPGGRERKRIGLQILLASRQGLLGLSVVSDQGSVDLAELGFGGQGCVSLIAHGRLGLLVCLV
ncbi:hypothetical protein ACP3WZ_25515, partial [Salmonella enterica]|uniref:hypothetical protein n=1 Tax=Salmonella enterica TaxID=28901 RepID=UPI003CFB47C9